MTKPTDCAEEFELIRRILNGDTMQFTVLVDNYKDISLSLAFSIIKNKNDAEEIVQDAFVKAYTNLHKFKFTASFSTWFYRIVVNNCYANMSREKRFNTLETDLVSYGNTGYDELRNQERKTIINEILNQLKDTEALIMRLYYLGEQSVANISEITNLSASNVKVTLLRARKTFYRHLDLRFGDEKKDLL